MVIDKQHTVRAASLHAHHPIMSTLRLQAGEDSVGYRREPTPTVEKKMCWLSLQVGNRIICMWATSAPRGPPFSVLTGESAQTMAVFRWQKSQFPCMRCYNAPELVVQCCLDSVTAPFNTAPIVPDPFFLYSFLSIWMWACSIGSAPTIHPHRRTKMTHRGDAF